MTGPADEELVRTSLSAQALSAQDSLAEPWLMASFCDPNYVVQSHHIAMSQKIEKWSNTPDGRLSISAPPRCGKSWMAIVWNVMWLIATDPTTEIIVACCTQKLVDQHSKDIKERIEEYGHLFDMKIKRGYNRVDGFTLTSGARVLLVGIGGMTTGFGAKKFLLDDTFKDWAEAMSPTVREKKWMWVTSVARTRLYPGSQLMNGGTRWNEDDLEGRFRKRMPGRWDLLRLPALADSVDDPLGRSVGDPLPVPQIPEENRQDTLHHWDGVREEQPFVVWEAMYQGNPHPPGGALVDTDMLEAREFLSPVARPVRRAVSVDPSVGSKSTSKGTSDGRQNTCGLMAGYLGDDSRVYLTDDETAVMTIEEWTKRACLLADRTGASVVFLESDQGGSAWEVIFKGVWRALSKTGEVKGPCPRLTSHRAKGSKEVRADQLAHLVEQDRVRTANKLSGYYLEMTTWRPGMESPGRIDAAGHLAMKLLPEEDGTFDGELVASAVTVSSVERSEVELPDWEDDLRERFTVVDHVEHVVHRDRDQIREEKRHDPPHERGSVDVQDDRVDQCHQERHDREQNEEPQHHKPGSFHHEPIITVEDGSMTHNPFQWRYSFRPSPSVRHRSRSDCFPLVPCMTPGCANPWCLQRRVEAELPVLEKEATRLEQVSTNQRIVGVTVGNRVHATGIVVAHWSPKLLTVEKTTVIKPGTRYTRINRFLKKTVTACGQRSRVTTVVDVTGIGPALVATVTGDVPGRRMRVVVGESVTEGIRKVSRKVISSGITASLESERLVIPDDPGLLDALMEYHDDVSGVTDEVWRTDGDALPVALGLCVWGGARLR